MPWLPGCGENQRRHLLLAGDRRGGHRLYPEGSTMSILAGVGKDIDAQMVVDVRHMLTKAGYGPS